MITVGTNSWVTIGEANTYFSTRLGADASWSICDEKEAALVTAFNWLMNSSKFSLSASLTAQVVKDAQCEMALFLIQNQPDIDIRMGLQAQGVTKAGIVKEEYSPVKGIPVPFHIAALLDSYGTMGSIHMNNLERNEAEGVDYDAYGNRLTDGD